MPTMVNPKPICSLWPSAMPGSAGSPAPIAFQPGATRWTVLLSALHFARQIACHQQAGDAAQTIFRRPQARVVSGEAKFERPRAAERPDVGIDAVSERGDDLARALSVAGPFGIPIAPETHGA